MTAWAATRRCPVKQTTRGPAPLTLCLLPDNDDGVSGTHRPVPPGWCHGETALASARLVEAWRMVRWWMEAGPVVMPGHMTEGLPAGDVLPIGRCSS